MEPAIPQYICLIIMMPIQLYAKSIKKFQTEGDTYLLCCDFKVTFFFEDMVDCAGNAGDVLCGVLALL